MYRATTRGESVSHELSYTSSPDDEVEDLYRLVSYVKSQHPELEAVCSGAIASDYQRLRVESLCQRLGLISLAPLWKRSQSMLMEDMIASGIDAIIIKVAGLGLIPEKHLGKDLQSMKPHLVALYEQYGCHICGEGGEYESLVLDCPFFTFGRIAIDESHVLRDREGGDISPSGILNIPSFHVETKTPADIDRVGSVHIVPVDFARPEIADADTIPTRDAFLSKDLIMLSVQKTKSFLHLSASMKEGEAGRGGAEGMEVCLLWMLKRVQATLAVEEMTLEDAVFVQLYLNDMRLFAAANRVYCAFFPNRDPPSRACIQLSQTSSCTISILALRKAKASGASKRVLHVQSISHWAPSCIGPYSQATSLRHLSFVAGQLGLVPSSMTFGDLGWQQEVQFALQHCQAVAIAVGADATRSTIKATIYLAEAFLSGLAEREKEALYTLINNYWSSEPPDASSDVHVVNEASTDPSVDSYLKPPVFGFRIAPIVSYIVVPALPKNANIEIQPFMMNNRETVGQHASISGPKDLLDAKGCTIEHLHEWRGSQQTGTIHRMRVELTSGFDADPPYAYLTFQDTHFLILQIHFPLPEQSERMPAAGCFREACMKLLNTCTYLCDRETSSITSAIVWYRDDRVNKSFAESIFAEISASSRTDVNSQCNPWLCLPSSGIGEDVWLADMILIDVLALDL